MSGPLVQIVGFELLDPWMLALALIVPLQFLLRRRRGEPEVRFAAGRFAEGLPNTWRRRLRWLPRALQGAALVLLAVALARPVRREPLPVEREGIDVLLCVDVSSSMSAKDLDPARDRLEVAKEAAARFVAGRGDDRIGLVGFARFPDLVCPLTRDHRALADLVARMEKVAADGPEDATAIGAAVARCAQVLKSSTSPSKVIVLLTDGEENVATSETPDEIAPAHAAQLCRELGVRAYSIVAGSGHVDRDGQVVPLDTRQARQLAETTGGRYFEATDAEALALIYAEIDELETVQIAEPRFRLVEGFLAFLAAAIALLFAGRWLESTALSVLP